MKGMDHLYEQNGINTDKLESEISEFGSAYSPKLTNTIRSMLKVNPKERSSCKGIFESLRKNRNNILNLDPM